MMSNLLTTVGVLAVLAAVAALTGNVWWAVLLAGGVLCAAGWASRPVEAAAAPVSQRQLQSVKPDQAAA